MAGDAAPGSLQPAVTSNSIGKGPESSVVLRMTRDEIGSFLGLTLETVSRTFSRMQDDGLLAVRAREIRVLKPKQLLQLVRRAAP